MTIEWICPYSALSLVFEIDPVERFDNLGKFRGYVDPARESARAVTPNTSTGNARRATTA